MTLDTTAALAAISGPGKIKPDLGTEVVSLARDAAHDYDPLGDGQEHHADAPFILDREPGTTWTTESYQGGQITKPKANGQTPGVGIYVDAKPGLDAVRMSIQTPKPGWKATIYAAPAGKVPASIVAGWTKVGGGTVRTAKPSPKPLVGPGK